MSNLRVRGLVAASFVALLTACATPASITPGAAETDVVAKLGNPVDRHRLPDGSVNLEYSTAPMGQYAWMVNVDGGRVRDVRQVLTVEEFAKLRIGKDTREDVAARFGRRVEETYLRLADRTVWSWRMKQDDLWPVWMNVQFDRQGVVREVFPTPDPAYLGGNDRDH